MADDQTEYVFRLYSSDKHAKMQVLVNDFQAVLEKHFPGGYHVELIDVLSDPDQATEDRVFVTPTLVKAHPEPVQRIIGNLSKPDEVLAILGILTRETKKP